MSHLDALTESERDALAQLQAITDGADVETQISLLQSVNWDVQVRPVSSSYATERVVCALVKFCHVQALTHINSVYLFV